MAFKSTLYQVLCFALTWSSVQGGLASQTCTSFNGTEDTPGQPAVSSSLLQARKQQVKQDVASSGVQQMAGLLEQLTEMKELEEAHVKKMETMEEEQAKKMKKMEEEQAQKMKTMEEEAASIKKMAEELRNVAPVQGFASLAAPTPSQTALLLKAQQLSNRSDDLELAPTCRGRRKSSFSVLTRQKAQASTHKSSMSHALGRCSDSELTLTKFLPDSVETSCCLLGSTSCAGCVAATGGACQKCAGGFRKDAAGCVSCANSAGWLSELGLSCEEIDITVCTDTPVRGQSSNAACCQCGGGHVTATPFVYPDKRWALGSEILLLPVPRTAVRYSLKTGCQLAAFNMTMDGETGAITSLPKLDKPTEPFNVQCEVSAHQAEGVAFSVVVTVAVDYLTYPATALLFHTTEAAFVPLTSSGEWENFSLACAPDAKWLEISGAGVVSLSDDVSSQSQGALTDLQEGQSTYTNINGALCFVTGWQKESSSSLAASQRKASFVALKPQMWTSLAYEVASVDVALGEELQPLKFQTPAGAGQGSVKPTAFTVACKVSGHTGSDSRRRKKTTGVDSLPFVFDGLLNTGFIAGHQVLQVNPLDGQVIVAPDESLAAVFDGVSAVGQARKALELSCGIWGSFAGFGSEVEPLRAELSVTIRDNFCWVSQTFQGQETADAAASSESQCRMNCRFSKSCSHWAWSTKKKACTRYRVQAVGDSFTAWAKITDCTDLSTCLQVTHPTWLLSGTYCPLGHDLRHAGVVYNKSSGGTPEDTVYLSKSEGSEDPAGCSKGWWIFQKPAPGRDFLDPKRGYFELTGEVLLCLPPAAEAQARRSTTLDWMGKECSAPGVPEPADGQLQSLVFDDPSTQQTDDHWLHPCDCAPEAWGSQEPVNPGLFENIPPGSSNSFIPVSFAIVSGQFACPFRQLLPGEAGVHFESESESMEPAECESRCKDEVDCNFFWHGSSHGALTCRLFSGCDSLVREFGLSGSLSALPRVATCQVSNPEACWATKLRRMWLTDPLVADASASASAEALANTYNPDKPEDPASYGMVAWFQSEAAGSEWISSVNDYVGHATSGTVTRRSASGFGAEGPVTYIAGSSSDGYTFGKVLQATFSVCSVTRYTGAAKTRILQGSDRNFFHGQHGGSNGVAYYGAMVTATPRKAGSQDWVVLCGTNKAKRVFDGDSPTTNIGTSVANVAGPTNLVINSGASESKETSDFAVMELITWGRVLSDAEFAAAIAYLNWKLEAGTYQAMQHLSTLSQASFFTKARELSETQTYTETLSNDYKVELRGWSQMSSFANGYVRDAAGSATAVVTGLTVGRKYSYNIYQVASESAGSNALSINSGTEFRTTQGLSTSPTASGQATATPRGEIVFEFTAVDQVARFYDVLSSSAVNTHADCPTGTSLTGCSCYSVTTNCAGAKSDGHRCTAWTNGKDSVQALARCGTLPFSSRMVEVESALSGRSDDDTTSATCPSGTVLTGCSCHATNLACDGAKSSGNTCTAHNGIKKQTVQAQARCWTIPGSSQWSEVLSSKSGTGTNDAASATCPTGTFLTGCTCYSMSKDCNAARSSANTCTAHNHKKGKGVYAQARCGAFPMVSLHLSGIALSGAATSIASRPEDPARSGMVAWFQSESAGSEWKSSVSGHVGKGGVTRMSASGFGADGPVSHIVGSSSVGYTFGKVLRATFSMCSVTRYTGAAQGRILKGADSNFFHGQHGGSSGVAYYGAHVTANPRKTGSQDWVVLCGTNKAKRVFDGDNPTTNIGTAVANVDGPIDLVINSGSQQKTEKSDFAVMELITWQRVLSDAEFAAAIAYLNWKLEAGTFQATQHPSSLWQASFLTKGQLEGRRRRKKAAATTTTTTTTATTTTTTTSFDFSYLSRRRKQAGSKAATAAVSNSPIAQANLGLGFLYLHLHEACDAQLLLGGLGVEVCSRPTFRTVNSHEWTEKRPLPDVFAHGSELAVSCWKERFVGFQGFQRSAGEMLHCVNGEWYNTQEKPELQGFTCESCLFVGGKGLASLAKRNEQELYYFNKMSLSVYSELGTLLTAATGGKYCLRPSSNTSSTGMVLTKDLSCAGSLLVQTVATSAVKSRLMRLAGSQDQCLQGTADPDGLASAVHLACNESEPMQLIIPSEVPSIIWDLHVDADKKRAGDLHTAYSSYCGAHGALNTLSFGQIFGGVTSGGKSNCHFAPVVLFGDFANTGIKRDKLSTSWPDWHHLLSDNAIQCPLGHALTGLKLDSVASAFLAECSLIGGIGASFDYFSNQVEVAALLPGQSNWLKTMKMLTISCGDNGLLSGFHFEYSEGGKWARAKYTCSKAGGAPVVMEPAGVVTTLLLDEEGIYCPALRDFASGRLSYTSEEGEMLEFKANGSWCIGSNCSAQKGAVTPLGLSLSSFDVVAVSDYTAEFLAAGLPEQENRGDPKDLAKRLKALKPPKRPDFSQAPKMGDFKAEQPTYSEECLNYEDLWKNLKETYTNNEGEETTEESKLEADKGTKGAELLDYHPCAVAAGAGGIFGKIGMGNGKLAPENMMYSDWNNCMQGDIERAMSSAHADMRNTLVDLTKEVAQTSVKLSCEAVPDVEIAPLGMGTEVEPDAICGAVTDFVGSLDHLPLGLMRAKTAYDNEAEGYAACNPLQVGFSRMFCDVHCVRDAVIRGDRTIIRNLEKAAKISNDNMKKMMEWTSTQTEFLDKKLDYNLAVNTAYLQHISANTAPSEEKLLQGAHALSSSMLSELSGFAQLASFSEPSRVTARDVLERFASSAEVLDGAAPNATRLATVLNQISSLHQVLRSASGGLSKAQAVGKQLSQDARSMQEQAGRQRQVLGVYRLHSKTARTAAQGWRSRSDQRAMLVSLDQLWWQLRDKLDRYLDTAEEEVKHFEAAFATMADYEHCSAGFSNLLATYTTSTAVMEESHRQLRATWRETSNLVGELAAVMVDGEAFSTFMHEEGCDSTLAQQTVRQARLAVGGMRLLIHRFRVAGLGEPDTSSLEQAVQRIQDSYAESVKSCRSLS